MESAKRRCTGDWEQIGGIWTTIINGQNGLLIAHFLIRRRILRGKYDWEDYLWEKG